MPSNLDFAHQAPGATGVDPDHPARARFEIVDADRGVIRPANGEPWRKKFAICGFAASSRMAAPFEDKDYYIVGLNQLYRHTPRADVWYDIHDNFDSENVEGTDHVGWLAGSDLPVFMCQKDARIPTAVNYPVDEVIRRVLGTDYFTSTVAFMLAWSIMMIDDQVEAEVEALRVRLGSIGRGPSGVGTASSTAGPVEPPRDDEALSLIRDPAKLLAWQKDRYAEREIAIFGIDLVVGEEYDFQKACVEYVIGLANARGITVRIPPQSALLKQRWRYGYFREPDNQLVRRSELKKRGVAIQQERAQLIDRLHMLDGAAQNNGYWEQVEELRSRGAAVKLNEEAT
mgnify:FL=1